MKRLFRRKKEMGRKKSLTLYLTEETTKEFAPAEQEAAAKKEPVNKVDYGKRLQYSSDILAVMISCLLGGVCYWQWQTPPMVTEYEQSPEQMSLEQPLAVDVKNDGLFASMTIEICDYDSLEQAHLLVNGESAGTFSGKQLVVRVYPGDILEIDTSAYLNSCRFQVIKKSSHIREETIEDMVTTENGYGWIGKISFK